MIENLRSLAILAAVVEQGSFRGAGGKLGLSASVVSHHISNLEKRLDCTIFHRTSRRLQLTDKGVVLHKAAREMVDVINGGLNEISDADGVQSGNLRIAVPQFLINNKFQHAIDGFLRAYPKVNMDLTMTADIQTAMDGDFDVLVTRCHNINGKVTATRLTSTPICAFAAPDLAAKINKLPLTDVPDQIPLMLVPGFRQIDWENAFSNGLGGTIRIPSFRFKCDVLSLAYQMVCLGSGIAVLPEQSVTADLRSGRLVKVLSELHLPDRVLNVVFPDNAEKTSLTRLFVDHILLEYAADALIDQVRMTG